MHANVLLLKAAAAGAAGESPGLTVVHSRSSSTCPLSCSHCDSTSARLQVALLRPRVPINLSNSLLSKVPGGTVCGGGRDTGALAFARRSSSSGSAWLQLLLGCWLLLPSSAVWCWSSGWELLPAAASSPAGWLVTGSSAGGKADCGTEEGQQAINPDHQCVAGGGWTSSTTQTRAAAARRRRCRQLLGGDNTVTREA
jgi:hypothetical protein